VNRSNIGPLSVSPIALGAMLFGARVDEGTSRRLLDQYVEWGGNFLDTANNYAFWVEGAHAGSSEELLGRWLKDRGRRDDIVVASKVGARPVRKGAGLGEIEGLGRDVIVAQVEASLKRLGTDYLDLCYAHIDDRTVPLEDTLEGFARVVDSGKVRAIGCSNYSVWRIERALQLSSKKALPRYVVLQQQFSYLRPRPYSDFRVHPEMGLRGGYGTEGGLSPDHLDYIRFNPDFRVVAYTPLLRGGYANPERLGPEYRTDDNRKRSEALTQVAAETSATAGQVALAWMMQSSPAIIPLVAVSTGEQLSENLAATELRLSPDQLNRLTHAA